MARDSFSQAKNRTSAGSAAVTPPPLPGERPATKLVSLQPPPLPHKRTFGKGEILNPEDLDPLKDLLLFARVVVEGWFAGKHRSIDFGSSAEFEEHKAYVEGDPVSMIDWQVYARSRHLVVRKNREEKDMSGYVVMDVSGSMGYQSSKNHDSKQVRAAKIAAALIYLMMKQGDKSALTLFNDRIVDHVPAGSTRRHLFDVVTTLERVLQNPTGKTEAHSALDLCLPLFKKRGSLVVISDFFTDLDQLFDALAQFQHQRYQILLLHVIDPDERLLPDVALARFVDMETRDSIQVAPDEIRKAYRAEMEEMQARLEAESLRRGIQYHVLPTEEPYKAAIEAWLGLRGRSG
ncbi:MAG: DUF58 domain-containing protein [Verrucomicrobiales bacterium]|nr:DUF58 domain-containing protein [Verrucomicrobiales bacterium]